MAGAHDLVHGRTHLGNAEELGEVRQAKGIATDRPLAGGKGPEVPLANVAEARASHRRGIRRRLLLSKPAAVRLVLDGLSDGPGATMTGDLFGTEPDGDRVVVAAHGDALADEPPRHRVGVAVERDAKGLRDSGAGIHVVGVERAGGQRPEPGLLLVLEDEGRDLAGLVMDALVAEAVTPFCGLLVELEQAREATARPEPVPDKADGPLDATLALGLPRRTRDNGKSSANVGVCEEPRVEERRLASDVLEDDGLHVVEDVAGSDAAVERDCAIHATQERTHLLAEYELDVEQPRVTEHGHERAHLARHAGHGVPEVGPVDHHRLARCEVEREERLRCRRRSELLDAVPQNADPAGVAVNA